jgi:hypothetical protein
LLADPLAPTRAASHLLGQTAHAAAPLPDQLEFNQVSRRTDDPVSNVNVSAISLKIIKIFNFLEFDGARDSVSPS